MLPRITVVLLIIAGAAYASTLRPSAPSAERGRMQAAATPAGYVYVPGGDCWIGTDDADSDDDVRPRRRIFVFSFYIGRCEVTHAEWKRFRPSHSIPVGCEEYPITNVSYEDAEAYSRFVGGRLPEDVEWEKAARGTDGRRYPWGNDFDATMCNLRSPLSSEAARACRAAGIRPGIKPVGRYAAGASPYGALDMAGNAWEWVAGHYRGDPKRRIIRGGAVGYFERSVRTYHKGIEGTGVT